jgi:D-tyrosyl-tRNA(Tyr) deacylase
MRAVIQRVLEAKVEVEGNVTGEIKKGLLALVGFENSDDITDFKYMIDKIYNLRIFEDGNDKMNLSVKDTEGRILVVPNFTLYGDVRRGKRPSFSDSSTPEKANGQFAEFCKLFSQTAGEIGTGVFQAKMKVTLTNDGPVTILLDSKKIF